MLEETATNLLGGRETNITIEKGKTLLVDGPASVILVSGKVEVFGLSMENSGRVVIRDGKRMPFTIEKTANFDIFLGENARAEKLEGNTIPSSWKKAYEELLAVKSKPAIALVLGGADSGKTSFCTYIANKLFAEKLRVAILDGDIGQSDIGPPCTMAYAFMYKQVTDLFDLELENAFFVGVTSPSKDVEKVLSGLAFLKKEIFNNNPDFIVINTDGWIEGEEAVQYKFQLTERMNPDIVFCIQQDHELTSILTMLKNRRILIIESPSVIKQRSREKRRNLREMSYIKFLRNAKVQSIPLRWVKIENGEIVSLKNLKDSDHEGVILNLLEIRPLYVAEFEDRICIVIGGERVVDPEIIKRTEEFTGKKVVVRFKGDEEGLLIALYNDENRFLGIGVLREIDYTRKIMKLYTPVSKSISKAVVGKIHLDKNFREIPAATIEQKR